MGNGNPKEVQFFACATIFNYAAAKLGLNVDDSVQTFPFNGCIHVFHVMYSHVCLLLLCKSAIYNRALVICIFLL